MSARERSVRGSSSGKTTRCKSQEQMQSSKVAHTNGSKTNRSTELVGGETTKSDETHQELSRGRRWRCSRCPSNRRATLANLIEQFEQQSVAGSIQCDEHETTNEYASELLGNNKPLGDSARCVYNRTNGDGSNGNGEAKREASTAPGQVIERESCANCINKSAAPDLRRDCATTEVVGVDQNNGQQVNESVSGDRRNNVDDERLRRVRRTGVQVLPSNQDRPACRPVGNGCHKATSHHCENGGDDDDDDAYSADADEIGRRECYCELCACERRRKRVQLHTSGEPSAIDRKRATSTTLGADLGPQIVRHSSNSSKHRLRQLARLRRKQSLEYRVKRPKEVERVEGLIKELEQVSDTWNEDERLLERAARRDWPLLEQARLQQLTTENDYNSDIGSSATTPTLAATRLDFGQRNKVHMIEMESIERAHAALALPGQGRDRRRRQVDSISLNGSLSSRSGLSRRSIFADKYWDDLAVRRLRQCSSTPPPSQFGLPRDSLGRCSLSYLLCTPAYTPSAIDPMEDQIGLERERLLHNPFPVDSDDLLWRRVRSPGRAKMDEDEPPFGMPKRSLQQYRSSGSIAVGRSQTEVGTKVEPSQRSESRVSFAAESEFKSATPVESHTSHTSTSEPVSAQQQRCVSVDSGVEAPATGTATAATTPHGDEIFHDEENNHRNESDVSVTEFFDEKTVRDQMRELVIEPEEAHIPETGCPSSPGEFEFVDDLVLPSPERLWTQVGLTPAKQRPHIPIENPRSKSPLLRAPKLVEAPPNDQTVPMSAGGSSDRSSSDPRDEEEIVIVQSYTDSMKKHRQKGKRNSMRECSQNGLNEPVATVKTYSSTRITKTLKTMRKERLSGSKDELECEYEFSDDTDNDNNTATEVGGLNRAAANIRYHPIVLDDKFDQASAAKTANHISRSGEASDQAESGLQTSLGLDSTRWTRNSPSTPNRLQGVDEEVYAVPTMKKISGTKSTSTMTTSQPLFSIGEYKPLNKPNLKIL